MTYGSKYVGIIFFAVLLTLIAGWAMATEEPPEVLMPPIGHHVEQDSSRMTFLNSLKSIVQARNIVAENISNANSISYKRICIQFLDATTLLINRDFTQGKFVKTDRSMDVGIDGDGFFQVSNTDGSYLYTRCGSLIVNDDGLLMHPDGYLLDPPIHVGNDPARISIKRDGTIYSQQNESPFIVGHIQLFRFPCVEGLSSKSSGLFIETDRSGSPIMDSPGRNGIGELQSGYLESSNVNEKEELRILEGLRIFEEKVQNALDIVSR